MSVGLSRFLETIRPLRLTQITSRFTRRMLATSIPSVTGAVRRKLLKTWREAVTTKPIALQGRARFLNVERALDSPSVWNDRDSSRLWLYQLHYFNGLAGAALTDPHAASAFVGRWIRENPPAKGPGWEPFPTSLRIGNWIKFAMQGGELNQAALDSLATQAEWLRRRLEYHLLGNHLLFNACALYSAGCFFDGGDAERWRAEGAKLIEEQIQEQILADGMHFELSAMYQLLVLESLLDILNLSSAFDLPAPSNLPDACRSMMGALDLLTHPDGNIAQFNDAALDEAPAPAKVREYANRLGLNHEPRPAGSSWLPQAGYARLSGAGAVALVDVAEIGPSYLPAHAHADTFTFELSIGRQRVIVDTGISTYEVGDVRHWERGTLAHNTVAIDGGNSSDVWHAFRVGTRARVLSRSFDTRDGAATVQGAHDGYRALGVRHARTWSMQENLLRIVDDIEGRGSHSVECALHFHPDIQVDLDSSGAIARCDGAVVARITLTPGLEWSMSDYAYHPGFGISQRAQRLLGRGVHAMPLKLLNEIHWSEARAN